MKTLDEKCPLCAVLYQYDLLRQVFRCLLCGREETLGDLAERKATSIKDLAVRGLERSDLCFPK
jgi:hypothetical protein